MWQTLFLIAFPAIVCCANLFRTATDPVPTAWAAGVGYGRRGNAVWDQMQHSVPVLLSEPDARRRKPAQVLRFGEA